MWEEIEKGNVRIFKVDTSENPTGMLTKALPREKFELCLILVGLCVQREGCYQLANLVHQSMNRLEEEGRR